MASSTGCAQRGRSVRSGHARTPRQPSTWPRTRQTFIPNRALRALQELHPALYHNQIRTMCTDCGFEQRQDMYLHNHGLAKDCPYISGSQDPLLPQDSRPGDVVSRRTCSIISEISTFHLLVVSLVLLSGTNSPQLMSSPTLRQPHQAFSLYITSTILFYVMLSGLSGS